MSDIPETFFVEKITYNGPHIITSTSSQGYSFSFSSSETFEVKIEKNMPNNEIYFDTHKKCSIHKGLYLEWKD